MPIYLPKTDTTGITDVVDDTSPQLGGDLDVNGQKIVSVVNGNIDIEPNGTGNVLLGNFTLDADQTVGAGQDNYVFTYDNATGLISLEAAPGGTGDLLADGSVPLTANWDVGSFDITAAQFHSDIAIGTAPFTVVSTTVVTNLNADLLDGNHATAFATAAQGTTADAALARSGGNLTGNVTADALITVDGRDLSVDGAKLDGIESGADVTDTANVTTAGALMDSEVTNLAQVKAFDSSDYATAAHSHEGTAILATAATDGHVLTADGLGGAAWEAVAGGSGGDLKADGTVPLTANWDVGSFTITALRFVSDVSTGTAPFGVSSTTVVTNLNADLLDGNHAAAFAVAAHNHDASYISIVSSPTTGNFPQLTAGGELINSTYDETSFATAAQGTLADSALQDLDIDSTPDTDHLGEGITATFTAAEALVFGDVCYVNASGNMAKADASAVGTSRAIAMALGTISGAASGSFLLFGVARDDTWAWAVGGAVYLSETAGALTQTAPTTASSITQVIGVATHADRMLFNPSLDILTHA